MTQCNRDSSPYCVDSAIHTSRMHTNRVWYGDYWARKSHTQVPKHPWKSYLSFYTIDTLKM
jgi:hypothetical protein